MISSLKMVDLMDVWMRWDERGGRLLALHDDLGFENTWLDFLVGENNTTIAKNLITNMHILTKNRHVFDAGPLANGGVPTDDTPGDTCMFLHTDTPHDRTSWEPDTRLNDTSLTNGDIRANQTSIPNVGTFIHEHVADYGWTWGEACRGVLLQGLEVESKARVVVAGLADVHPESR